jgi:hypothetical protein
VAGGRGGHDAVLADQELLDAVCGTDLCNDLGDLGVVVAAITANDERGALGTFGDGVEDGGNEVLGVVGLLEDLDLLAKTGAVRGLVSRCLLSDSLLIAALVGSSSQASSDRLLCVANSIGTAHSSYRFFPKPNRAVKEGYLRARLLVLEGLGLDGADAHDCDCVRGV